MGQFHCMEFINLPMTVQYLMSSCSAVSIVLCCHIRNGGLLVVLKRWAFVFQKPKYYADEMAMLKNCETGCFCLYLN